MPKNFCARLLLALLLSSVFQPLIAADFNIKIRKQDINELKQQFMPLFEQKIILVEDLLACLKQNRSFNICLDKIDLEQAASQKIDKQTSEQAKAEVQNYLEDKQLEVDVVIEKLDQLLTESKKIKACLDKGQTANDLKDCVVKK